MRPRIAFPLLLLLLASTAHAQPFWRNSVVIDPVNPVVINTTRVPTLVYVNPGPGGGNVRWTAFGNTWLWTGSQWQFRGRGSSTFAIGPTIIGLVPYITSMPFSVVLAPTTAPACVPTSCAAQLASCGTIADGCGATLNCGSCPTGQTCGAGGVPNICASTGASPTPGACTPGQWTLSTVDSAGDVGRYSAIGVDGAGTVHIVYYDIPNHQLKHASRAPGGAWAFRVIDTAPTDAFRQTDLTVDRSGGVHVTYQHDFGLMNRRDLKYAYLPPGGAWTAPRIIDTGQRAGFGSSIHVDANGGVHVSTVRYRGGVDERARYLYRPPGGAWQPAEDVGAAYAGKTALWRESNGVIHVSYTSSRGLMHRRRLGTGNWEAETVVVSNSTSQPSARDLARDSRGRMHAIHFGSTGRALYSIQRSPGTPPTGGQWSNLEVVDGQSSLGGSLRVSGHRQRRSHPRGVLGRQQRGPQVRAALEPVASGARRWWWTASGRSRTTACHWTMRAGGCT